MTNSATGSQTPKPPAPALSSRLRALVSLVVCVVAVGIGAGMLMWLISLKQPPESRAQVEKTYNVEVFDVEVVDLQEIISSFGTARPDREVILAAQVAGQVVDIHPRLNVGQKFRAVGELQRWPVDVLVHIDGKTYQERVEQAESRIAEDHAELKRVNREKTNNDAVLAQAKADVVEYRKEYDRVVKLQRQNVAVKSEVTRVRLELQRYEAVLIRSENERALFPFREQQIQARIKTHEANLAIAKLDVSRTAVKPPFAGVLSEVTVEQGQYVGVGDPLVRLTDLSKVEIPVPLTLTDYEKIESKVRAEQQPRAVLAENETGKGRWFGYVVRVAPEADELTRTVKVFIEVENHEQAVPLLPGTFVHARIDGPILKKVLVVPRDSIVNGRLFVATKLKLVGNRADRANAAKDGPEEVWAGVAEGRQVKVKQTLQSLAVIEFGVEPGEKVILTNLDIIHDGANVRIQSSHGLSEELKKQRIQIATLAGGGNGTEH